MGIKLANKNEYKRPKPPMNYINTLRGVAEAGLSSTVQYHLAKRLRDEEDWLKKLYRQQAEGTEGFIRWFKETDTKQPKLVVAEVARLNKKKGIFDYKSKEGQATLGEILLSKFIERKRDEVINLRKCLGLEYSYLKNSVVVLTSGIERSDLFRLFGSPLTKEELKKSYKSLAKEYHPDTSELEDAENIMASITKAYKVLVANWDLYNPANLAIEEEFLKEALDKKFSDPILTALMEKS